MERMAQPIGMLSSTPPSITLASDERDDDSLKTPYMLSGNGKPSGLSEQWSSRPAQILAGSNAPGYEEVDRAA